MGHGSSGDNHTKSQAVKDEEKCDGKEKNEMEDLLDQCSQFEEMDTQDFSDSPILFPSQTSHDKEKNEDKDSDCYEIVDNVTNSEKEKHVKEQNEKRLEKKRQRSDKSGEYSSEDNINCKRRRVESENNGLSNTSQLDKCLLRVYKREAPQNIEEAGNSNLFYAPRHVKAALYTATIVRKLETFRRRLRHAQSSLRSCPLRSKAIEPILAPSRGRVAGRVKRVSILKKTNLYYKRWAERRRNNDSFVAALLDMLESKASKELHMVDVSSETPSEQRSDSDDDVVCTKVSPKKPSRTAEITIEATPSTAHNTDVINDAAMKTVRHVAIETGNCHVAVETVNRNLTNETVKNDVAMESAVVTETPNNETLSPVKQVLPEARRRIILEEANSDGDLEKFNFQPSVSLEKNNTEEEDCVVVEAPSTSVAMETSGEENADHIECPMCYKKFPPDTIEQHAFLCNGPNESSTSSVRTVNVENAQMSPVIKTRTPTKVKELKLLAKVEIQADEFRVERKDMEKKTANGKMDTNTKQSSKRVSLEPRVKLGDRNKLEENKSTLRQDKQPPRERRVTVSNARRNLQKNSLRDISRRSLDFVPLEFVEQKNKKIPSKDVRDLLSFADTSRSDEEFRQRKINTSKKKKNLKKTKVSSNGQNATEYCYVCAKDIPRLEFTEHVNEELARCRKEDEIKDFDLSLMSSQSQTSDDVNDENWISSESSVPLPDLAEMTSTWRGK